MKAKPSPSGPLSRLNTSGSTRTDNVHCGLSPARYPGVMPVPWDVLASTTGAVAATVVGVVVGGVVSRRGQDRHWLRDTQTEAYAAVLREYTRIEFDLRAGYHHGSHAAPDWARWGAALATLSLVASPEVAAAAEGLSSALRRFEIAVTAAQRPTSDELAVFSGQVARAQMAFVNAARRALDGGQRPLDTQLGGPPLD